MNLQPVDQAAVQSLAFEYLLATRRHFLERPRASDANFEALNAIAVALSPILAGARAAGREEEARAFFALALENQIAQDMQRSPAHGS